MSRRKSVWLIEYGLELKDAALCSLDMTNKVVQAVVLLHPFFRNFFFFATPPQSRNPAAKFDS